MGLRLRRRLRIARGIRFNLSKSGVSTSVGGHGARLNLSKRGKMTTLGLPGSGLSYWSNRTPWGASGGRGNGTMIAVAIAALAIIAVAIFSAS